MEEPIRFGTHELRFEEPDLVIMTWRGTMDLADMERFEQIIEGYRKRAPKFYLISDVHEAGSISASARKKIAGMGAADNAYLATIAIGASFPIRVLLEMVIKASRLITKNSSELVFVSSLDEAREWARKHRAQHAA